MSSLPRRAHYAVTVATWNKLTTDATKFAVLHDFDAQLPATRLRRVPTSAGEQASDERLTDSKERFRTEVFNTALDAFIAQITDRFAPDKMQLTVQMQYFTPWKLMTDEDVPPESMKELCSFYGLDPVVIARERAEFRVAYRSVHAVIDVRDMQPKCRDRDNDMCNM